MITSFFKPSSSQKVKPVSSCPSEPAALEDPRKRQRDESSSTDEGGGVSNKRPKPSDASSEVQELLSYLEHDESAETTWKKEMEKLFSCPSFDRLAKFVSQQRKTKNVFPPAPDTFGTLNLTPLNKVKIVIVGQDPYHGPSQAHGLCFSVRKGVRVPPSLRNMYKELLNDEKLANFTSIPTHGYLERWAKQGVLMINTVLTVRQGEANSHKKKGWELVTDEIIRAVDRRAKANGMGVVFLLWGKPATEKAKTALAGSSRHTVICTSHPSPLGATKTKTPFLGSKCFSRANEALKELGYDEIDWRVDGGL